MREALRRPGVVLELFATPEAAERHREMLAGTPFSLISARAAASLSSTVSPQGVVAVCRRIDVPLAAALDGHPRLVVGMIEPNDPGNLGTILRTADAAGADAVVVAGRAVDLYNGKAIRASAGSLFHLNVAVDVEPLGLLDAARAVGLRPLATTAVATLDLAAAPLAEPTLWLFGSEAHGLSAQVLRAATAVRVPIYGKAESLNLAAAAAVCLYASAFAQRSMISSQR